MLTRLAGECQKQYADGFTCPRTAMLRFQAELNSFENPYLFGVKLILGN